MAKTCPVCGTSVTEQAAICLKCKTPFGAWLPEARKAVLQKAISEYVSRGYRVMSLSDYTAQLVKPKTFSCLWSFLWLLLFGVGLIVYLLWYAAKRDQNVFLTVDEIGRVHQRG
jgi:hypothetical protein